jgi:hypothetical protein
MKHIHYAKWIPVHLKGMTGLFGRHPEVLIILNVKRRLLQSTTDFS